MRVISGLLRNKRRLAVVGAVLALLGVAGVIWFEPHKLFIDERVNESLLGADASPTQPGATQPSPRVLASGAFRPLEHDVKGTAKLIRLADGRTIVRFEGFETSNGPDLVVYLSELPSTLGWRAYGKRFFDLGELKGNVGDQNYVVPASLDLSKYQSVVVWCRRFTVGFAVAPLT